MIDPIVFAGGLFAGAFVATVLILVLATRVGSADDRAVDRVRVDALIYGTGILVRVSDGKGGGTLERLDPTTVRLVDVSADPPASSLEELER